MDTELVECDEGKPGRTDRTKAESAIDRHVPASAQALTVFLSVRAHGCPRKADCKHVFQLRSQRIPT
jgi:hypothetical protein